ncbi:MAG: hypothetical protein GY711_34325 [bacterium]|nr:hypothetical protein [bacterium]
MSSPLQDELLAHEAFLERLALRLVGDASRADDLVQETWLAAYSHPPRRGGALRAWLGTIEARDHRPSPVHDARWRRASPRAGDARAWRGAAFRRARRGRSPRRGAGRARGPGRKRAGLLLERRRERATFSGWGLSDRGVNDLAQNLAPGIYDLGLTLTGHARVQREVTVRAGERTVIEERLQRE